MGCDLLLAERESETCSSCGLDVGLPIFCALLRGLLGCVVVVLSRAVPFDVPRRVAGAFIA